MREVGFHSLQCTPDEKHLYVSNTPRTSVTCIQVQCHEWSVVPYRSSHKDHKIILSISNKC